MQYTSGFVDDIMFLHFTDPMAACRSSITAANASTAWYWLRPVTDQYAPTLDESFAQGVPG